MAVSSLQPNLDLDNLTPEQEQELCQLKAYTANHVEYIFEILKAINPEKYDFACKHVAKNYGSKTQFGIRLLSVLHTSQYHTQWHFKVRTFQEANTMICYMWRKAELICQKGGITFPPDREDFPSSPEYWHYPFE